eukprot:CAMPEP_0113935236 /NCGR_PEP_ID=MMETSP1339-20121228/2418_1 /TAXON_ID=94617 /ORGANISM="Fibrocapsa japonica" /LENGTH=490 /DNA_ID=CAMNT_0000937307 /DNA_START=60 /DNA_END=1532 /DNA_ORIENTATION=- /assembly_acc=CAM_ASM_000762
MRFHAVVKTGVFSTSLFLQCCSAFLHSGFTTPSLQVSRPITRLLSTSTEHGSSVESFIPVNADDVDSDYEPSSPFLQIMKKRGFFHQCTNLEGLDKAMLEGEKENKPVSAYLGFDATADSLHVGSLLQIMILRHLQKCGHRPIVLVGGGTTKVGDPSGKDESRKMLTEESIQANIDGIAKVFERFLTFGEQPTEALLVNNDEWLSPLQYLQFLRDYGPYFTINRMMNYESVKVRLDREQPLTFLEFNYMILQAYDFLELRRRHDCILQLGGSDQWGNIVNGCDLNRKADQHTVYGLTAPLITTSDGKKMGKTANGAMWLNKEKLSEYEYWQFWRNTNDADVARFLKLFTELSLEEIDKLTNVEGAAINQAKVVLADEATRMLHGADCLPAIHDTVQSMFAGKGKSNSALQTVEVSQAEVDAGIPVVDLYMKLGMTKTKSEGRRLIKGGGARLNDEKITEEHLVILPEVFDEDQQIKLSSGKKKHGIIQIV